MLTYRSAEWDRQLRMLRQHGMSVADTVRHSASQTVFEDYPVLEYNCRMTDIQIPCSVAQRATRTSAPSRWSHSTYPKGNGQSRRCVVSGSTPLKLWATMSPRRL